MISYRAPAKMILSGEHSVVYGKPAFVSSINQYLTASADFSDLPSDEHKLIITAVKRYLRQKAHPFRDTPIHVSVQSEIPIGRGLGSSAAYAVAGVAAVMHLVTGTQPDHQVVNSVAYVVEKKFHGNPSGVDISASCYDGLIYFRKEFEFLKTISALAFKIPPTIGDRLYLIDSGKPAESTAQMIGMVGKKYNASPFETVDHLNQLEKVTKRMVIAVVGEDSSLFEQCVEENQKLLVRLGVVSPQTQILLSSVSSFGVGKVTGGGGRKKGSGYILFCSRNNAALEKELKRKHIVFMKLHTDTAGLTLLTTESR